MTQQDHTEQRDCRHFLLLLNSPKPCDKMIAILKSGFRERKQTDKIVRVVWLIVPPGSSVRVIWQLGDTAAAEARNKSQITSPPVR